MFADTSIQHKVQTFFLELLADCRISDNNNLNIRAAWKFISGYTHESLLYLITYIYCTVSFYYQEVRRFFYMRLKQSNSVFYVHMFSMLDLNAASHYNISGSITVSGVS